MNTRNLTISSISGHKFKPVPYIRLQGRWLRELGFEIGRKIEVEESENLIVIRIASTDESEVEAI